MYNLYARKREQPNFEYINTFENVNQKYSMIDELDKEIYKEAIVVSENGCEMYVEFPEKEKTLKKVIRCEGKQTNLN